MEAEVTEVPSSEPAPPASSGGFDSYFKLSERGTNIGTEVRAGVTTFLVMAYIIFLNPLILSNMFPEGAERDAFIPAAAAATALLAGLLTIVMGLAANYPIALAAGLGINAIVAFTLVLGLGLSPAGAMGVIVLEGLIVLVLVIVGLREAIMNAVPLALKRAIGVGIGLFILFIGFVDGGLIVPGNPIVAFNFPVETQTWVFVLGLALTIVLFVLKVRAALLISIIVMSIVAYVLGLTERPREPQLRAGLLDARPIQRDRGLGARLPASRRSRSSRSCSPTSSTRWGPPPRSRSRRASPTPDGKVPGINRVLLVDSFAAAAGGAAGISSNTSYIESAAGVAEGGRTGLTSVIVGILFVLAVFVTPLASMVPFAATGPVLVVVGYLMATLIKDIDFGDVEVGIPALLAITLMPLTYSITVGIGAMFVTYVLIKAVRGKFGEVHWLMWVVAVAFAIYFAQAWINSVI